MLKFAEDLVMDVKTIISGFLPGSVTLTAYYYYLSGGMLFAYLEGDHKKYLNNF